MCMFYAADLLSIKKKSKLAILYYLSTTNNRNRKINKKDIDELNIEESIVEIKEPEQPFALRLYSFLLKGVVKVYALKLKSFQIETNELLSLMVVKKKCKEKNKLPKPKEEKKIILSDSEFISDIGSSEIENFVCENGINKLNDDLFVNYLEGDEISIEINRNKRLKKVVYDKIIELPISYITLNEKIKLIEKKFINNTFYDSPIIKKFDLLFKLKNKISIESSDIYDVCDYSSIEKARNSSNITIKSSIDDTDYEEPKLDFLEMLSNEIIFNTITTGNRYDKSLAFLKILELGMQGVICLFQYNPYGPIYMKPSIN